VQLVLSATGRIDGALMTAFTMVNTERNELAEMATKVLEIGADAAVLTGADARHAEEAIVQRCLGMLRAMPTSVLQDAALLWADCLARGGEEGAYCYLELIHHYRQVRCMFPCLRFFARCLTYTLSSLTCLLLSLPLPFRVLFCWLQALLDVDEVATQNAALPVEEFALQLVKSVPGAGEGQELPGPMRTVVLYRIAKKMVLCDAVNAIMNAADAEGQSA
jgi:hypothetical protein